MDCVENEKPRSKKKKRIVGEGGKGKREIGVTAGGDCGGHSRMSFDEGILGRGREGDG